MAKLLKNGLCVSLRADCNRRDTCKLSEQVLVLDFGDGRYFELRRLEE